MQSLIGDRRVDRRMTEALIKEKDEMIAALEEALTSATDTIDESGQEIVRLQGLVRGLELSLHNSHRDRPSQVHAHPGIVDGIARSESTMDEKDMHPPLVDRTNGKSNPAGSISSQAYHSLEGAAIVEGDESTDEDQTAGVVKDMQDRMMLIEFESTHLKEKLDKVLHTVDCLNDDIASLEKDNRDKTTTIETLMKEKTQALEQVKALQTELGHVSNSNRSRASSIAAPARAITPTRDPPKPRVWGSNNPASIMTAPEQRAEPERRKSAGSESGSLRGRSNSKSLGKQPTPQKKKIVL